MRVWALRKIDRNTWVLGNNAIVFDIVTNGRESYTVSIDDRFFKGRYDYSSREHKKWVDARDDLMKKARRISSDVKKAFGMG